MTEPAALTLELLADRLHAKAAHLSNRERDELCRALARHSPKIRTAYRWTDNFPLLFTVGVLTLLMSALTITWPVVATSLLIIGTVSLGVGGIQLWRFGWRTLDLVVGAYLVSLEK